MLVGLLDVYWCPINQNNNNSPAQEDTAPVPQKWLVHRYLMTAERHASQTWTRDDSRDNGMTQLDRKAMRRFDKSFPPDFLFVGAMSQSVSYAA
jgi:hypothetical protein